MNRARYYIIGGKRHKSGLREFGIVCSWHQNGRRETLRIDNVSPDLARLKRFVNRLNAAGASPIHLHDLTEDFVAG